MSVSTVYAVRQKQTGFTIVELLIVIVVIAILATISIVAYNGIQVRTRDSMRTDTIAKIQKALELYKIDHGRYPGATVSPGVSGWEASTDTEGSFMEYLESYGLSGGAPLDPVNNSTYRIFYYRYPPGAGAWAANCDVSKGGFYVLRVTFENAANKPVSKPVTTETCATPPSEWTLTGGPYFTSHSFEN